MVTEWTKPWDYNDIREYQRRVNEQDWPPLIITAAQTGGFHGKEANPNLPEQPNEIIQGAYECYQAGSSIIHVHVRDKEGKPRQDPGLFREVAQGIREKCPDVIIQFTTGGGVGMTLEERLRSLELGPEMASFNMGTLPVRFRGKDITFEGSRNDIVRTAKIMKEKDIKPEMEIYNIGQLENVDYLIRENLIDPPYFIDFVMGIRGLTNHRATPWELLHLIHHLPPNSIFNICANMFNQLPVTVMSMILGGHVRYGMEDNIYYAKDVLAESSAQLVARGVRIAKELNRKVATPSEARQILGLSLEPRKIS